jgi:hypothetical protein
MAHAMAAMYPPLQITDVLRAANNLSQYAALPRTLKADADPMSVESVIYALQALHDLRQRYLR